MENDVKYDVITTLKRNIQSNPNMISMTDDEMIDEISYLLNNNNSLEMQEFIETCSYKDKQNIIKSVFDSIRGMDVLGHIISDKEITEVMINGYDNIFVEKKGVLTKLDDKFESNERLADVINKFVSDSGRAVNESSPILDTRLADGSRVNIVLPPISLIGPIVTIRRFPEQAMTVDQLLKYGSITQEVAIALENLVKAKYNILVSGGTGSGKTTFLNALSNFIPSHERVITIEDSAELQIKNIPNLVRLETRNANSSGAGEISIKDLIKSSLRMRPERIIVGEVRGGEALDMLQAMNTGHDGSLSTGHANSCNDMLSRLETMVLSGAAGLPLDAIRQQIASAVDIIIQLSRLRDFSRKTMEISEVTGFENGKIILNPIFKFEEDPSSTKNKVKGELKRTKNKLVNIDKLQNSKIDLF